MKIEVTKVERKVKCDQCRETDADIQMHICGSSGVNTRAVHLCPKCRKQLSQLLQFI